MRKAIEAATGVNIETGTGLGTNTIVLRMPLWKRIAVAAGITGILGLAGLLYYNGQQKNIEPTLVAEAKDVQAPDKTRASITLTNGKFVYLDSAGNGELAMQNGVQLSKDASGKIIYDGALRQAQGDVQMNTLAIREDPK